MKGEPSIVDLVFGVEPAGRRKRFAFGVAVVVALYGSAFVLVTRLGRALRPPMADRSAQLHDEMTLDRAIDLAPPSVPAPKPLAASAERAVPAHATHVARARPAAPAQAGQLAAAFTEPADFTDSAFIVGSGTSYAGGATASTGTSRTPAVGPVAVAAATKLGPNRSRARPVLLDQSAWNCPWPAEADAQQVDEQTVVLRASVRADGHAERVDVVSDPGFGFGGAARLCALSTRFDPARDDGGQPIAAQSPPIRVHFVR